MKTIALAAVLVLGGASITHSQTSPFDDPVKIQRFVDGFGLSAEQVQKILASLDESFKSAEQVRDKMDALGIMLKKELAKDDADEVKVARYIDDISLAEAAIRKSKVLAWLRVRRLLSVSQRTAIKNLGKKPDVSSGPDCDRDDPLCGVGPSTLPVVAPVPFVKPNLTTPPSVGRARDGGPWEKLVKPFVTNCATKHEISGIVFVDFSVDDNGKGQVYRIGKGSQAFRRCVVDTVATITVDQKKVPDTHRRYRLRILLP